MFFLINLSATAFIFTLFIEFLTFISSFYYFIETASNKSKIVSFLVCLPIGIFFSIYFGVISYIPIMALLLLVNNKEPREELVINFLFSFLIIHTQGLVYSQIYKHLIDTKISTNQIAILLLYALSFILTALFLGPLLKYLYKNHMTPLNGYSSKKGKTYFYILSTLLVTMLITTSLSQQLDGQPVISVSLIAFIFIILFILTVSAIHISINKIKQKLTRQKEQEDLEQLILYANRLEQNQQQLRKFKHDYLNILLSLQDSIQREDINDIKKTFSEINHYSKDILNNYDTNASDLINVHVLSIKSLFMSKFSSWDHNLMKHVTFECLDSINDFYIEDIKLVRILGNMLDNAYEEVLPQSKARYIKIAIINQADSIELVMENSLIEPVKHFQNLLKANYTTKLSHSGLGLTTIKNLVDETANLNLYSSIDNDKLAYSISLLIEKNSHSIN